MRRTRRTIQMVVILAAALICGFGLYIGFVPRSETRIERDGWLLCFSNTRAAPQPSSSRVERFECKGKPVPSPSLQATRTTQNEPVLLSCPVGLLVFENPLQSWRVMSARKGAQDDREITTPPVHNDISDVELKRGYYSLPQVYQPQFGAHETTAALLRKKGTPADWCLVVRGLSDGVWCSPDALGQILSQPATETAPSPPGDVELLTTRSAPTTTSMPTTAHVPARSSSSPP
jgi:hypothetical protein